MKKKLESFLKISYLQLILGLILGLMTTVGVLIFFDSAKRVEQTLTERTKLREFILARAGAMAISDFFDTRKAKLLILANLPEIKSLDLVKGRAITQKFVQEMKDRPITSLGVLDKNGIILWSENPQQEKVIEGIDVSDRDYFLWLKNQNKPGNVYISKPVIARTGPAKDSWIIVMVTPLFNNNQFNGAIYAIIATKDLVEKYVEPLTVSKYSVQRLLTKDGEVIASTITEDTKTNLFQDNPSLINDLNNDQDGSLVTELIYPQNKSTKVVMGYAPLKIDYQSWLLMVSVPYSEVKDQMNPFSEVQNESLILLFVALITIIIFYIIAMRIAERQGYRNGYTNCLTESKKCGSKEE